jgi:3-oxo-4-pregnene-20-carboxyl-CoA dehydrogenase alpha subunit
MDFELDEAQQVIATSAREVLAGPELAGSELAGSELAAAEWGGANGAAAWRALAKAGLLALTLPGWLDGDELGVLEAALLLTEVGRQAAAVPALATIMLGALPVTRWGSRELQELVLVGVGDGEQILTAGVRERSAGMSAAPATTLTSCGSGPLPSWTVTGTKVGVPFAGQANWILVPASIAGGRAVAVVSAAAAGVTITRTPASGDAPEFTVRMEDAPVAGLLGPGEDQGEAVDGIYQLACAGAAVQADGVVAGALDLTAGYVAERQQFGRPLATFQAVAGQVADIYIASRTLHLAALSACWRLSAGLDARQDSDIAAYWLAQEAPPALRTCHQLHGGIGLDISYPLHRYSSMISDLARFVGGADYRLSEVAKERPC